MTAPVTTTADNRRGMILIVVLWAVAMMTVIVVALSAYSQKNLTLAGLEASRLRTEMMLRAAIELGKARILAATPDQRVFLDGTPFRTNVGGNRIVEISISDTAGRVDINRADGALLEALVAEIEPSDGALAELASRIIKLRQENLPKQQAQAADEAPAAESAKPANPAEFFSLAALYGLDGGDSAAVDKLLPFVDLYSIDGKINPMAASDTIMHAIPNLKPGEAATLAAARKLKQWNKPAVQNILGLHSDFLSIGESKIYRIEARSVSGDGVIAGSELTATVLLNESGDVPFRVLSWSW